MRSVRSAFALPLIATLAASVPVSAVDEPAPLAPPVGAYQFHSGGNASWLLDNSKPSFAEGGVTVVYEGIRVVSERLELIQALVAATKVMAPQTADMTPGPHGPPDGKVILDTREATSPRVGFRGLLTPTAVAVRRLPPDAGHPAMVQYHVDLPGSGDFAGQLKQPDGSWSMYRGWAEHIEIVFTGDTSTGSLTDLHVTRLILHGRAAAGDVPKRVAEVNRLKPEAQVQAIDLAKPLTSEQVAGHLDAPVITIDFDAEGRPSTQFQNAGTWGDPRLFNLR